MNQLTSVFKILSDETRLRLLLLLLQHDLCVCDMSSILDAPQSRVSKNLSKFRDLNLVVDERKDRFVFYSLNHDDKLLVQTLEYILDNKHLYPQVSSDYERLRNNEVNLRHPLYDSGEVRNNAELND